jgi:hypothetical protein
VIATRARRLGTIGSVLSLAAPRVGASSPRYIVRSDDALQEISRSGDGEERLPRGMTITQSGGDERCT